MADITYDFTAQSDVNPWSDSEWTKATGSANGRISLSLYTSVDATNAIYLYNAAPTAVANVISVSVVIGNFTGDPSGSRGGSIMATNGDGYFFLIRAADIRFYRTTPGGGANTLTQIGATTGLTAVDTDLFRFDYNVASGLISVKQNGVERFTATDTTHIFTAGVVDPAKVAALRLGPCSRAATGRLRSVTAINVASPQTLDTLTDPLVAGAAFSGTSTGFTDGAATLSSNGLSAAVTVASGAFSGTWPIAVDAQPYPTLPKSAQTITLTQGANTATIASDLEQPAGDDIVNFVSPITNDDTYPTYYIEQDGFTADGGQFVFTPYSDLVIAADGEITVTGAGVLVGYFIPATGTGAGNAYYYTFNVIDGAVVSGGRGLSVRGLSVRGLSVVGLSVRGLGGAAAMVGGFPYILPFVLS